MQAVLYNPKTRGYETVEIGSDRYYELRQMAQEYDAGGGNTTGGGDTSGSNNNPYYGPDGALNPSSDSGSTSGSTSGGGGSGIYTRSDLSEEITDPFDGQYGYNSSRQRVRYDGSQNKWVMPQNYVGLSTSGTTTNPAARANPNTTPSFDYDGFRRQWGITGDAVTGNGYYYTNVGAFLLDENGYPTGSPMSLGESNKQRDIEQANEWIAKIEEMGGTATYDPETGYYSVTDGWGRKYSTNGISSIWADIREAAGEKPSVDNPWYQPGGPLTDEPAPEDPDPVPGVGILPGQQDPADFEPDLDNTGDVATGRPPDDGTPPPDDGTPPPDGEEPPWWWDQIPDWFNPNPPGKGGGGGGGGGGGQQPPPWYGQIPGMPGKGGGWNPWAIAQPPTDWAPGGGWTPGGGMPGAYPPGYGGGYIPQPIERPPAAPPPWYQPGVATYDPYTRGRNLKPAGYAEGGKVNMNRRPTMQDFYGAPRPPIPGDMPTHAGGNVDRYGNPWEPTMVGGPGMPPPMPPMPGGGGIGTGGPPSFQPPMGGQGLVPGMGFPGQGGAGGKGGLGGGPPGLQGRPFPGQGNATGKGGLGNAPPGLGKRQPPMSGPGGPGPGDLGPNSETGQLTAPAPSAIPMPHPGFPTNPTGGYTSPGFPSPSPDFNLTNPGGPGPGYTSPGFPSPPPVTIQPPPPGMPAPMPSPTDPRIRNMRQMPPGMQPLPQPITQPSPPPREYPGGYQTTGQQGVFNPQDAVGIAATLVDRYMPRSRG